MSANLEEEWWRSRLLGTHPGLRALRQLFRLLPAPPRCVWCDAPFRGPFAPLFRLAGKGPFAKNPRFCSGCFNTIARRRGGVQIECSALFADVRGSTPMAERLGPARLHEVMDRFYAVGIDVLVEGGALVDRFLGDELVGYFVPGFAGPDHARRAVETALALLRTTGNIDGQEPWIPIGAGVNAGTAFVGNLGGGGTLSILTALGEDVNIAARLASLATAGEVLVTEATYRESGLTGGSEPRDVTLKGVALPITVRGLRPTAGGERGLTRD